MENPLIMLFCEAESHDGIFLKKMLQHVRTVLLLYTFTVVNPY